MMASILSVFLLLTVGFSSCLACKYPPQFWCSSPEIAAECFVTDQCDQFSWTKSKNAAPVGLELYMESLCPYCKEFINDQLTPTWGKIAEIINLTVVPYGNAKEEYDSTNKKWVFTCQHGPDECVGNLIETCAINLLKNQTVWYPFIACIEAAEGPSIKVLAQQCAKTLGINYDQIDACYNSQQGNDWQHQNAVTTGALNPPHQYVPWISLNGVHTDDIQAKAQEDLLNLICSTYQGAKPAGCTTFRLTQFKRNYKKLPMNWILPKRN